MDKYLPLIFFPAPYLLSRLMVINVTQRRSGDIERWYKVKRKAYNKDDAKCHAENKERGRADIQASGAGWQRLATEAAALFRRCQLFKPTQSLPTSLLLILFFLSLSFQHFSPHILVFSLNTSSPLRVPCHPSPPLLWRLLHSGVARKKPAEHVINSGLYFCAPNEMAIVLPGGFYVIIFIFFLLYPPQNVFFYPPAFLAESGRRRSLGVMVLLWIQVQNKMEDKARLLSNQRREWFHVWGWGGITDKLTTLTDFSFLRGCNFCVGWFLTLANVFRCPHRAGNVSQG